MEAHAREKDTAAWLDHEYSGRDSKSLFVIRAGSPEGIELPWPNVQRLIARLIKEDRFFTQVEQDNFDDVDPTAILSLIHISAFQPSAYYHVRLDCGSFPAESERTEDRTEAERIAALCGGDV